MYFAEECNHDTSGKEDKGRNIDRQTLLNMKRAMVTRFLKLNNIFNFYTEKISG